MAWWFFYLHGDDVGGGLVEIHFWNLGDERGCDERG